MADVKWIKITTDIFDDEKIILIESLPDAYAIITVWFKLLCLAGKQNNSGVFLLGRMPYTDKMLATIFRMKESTVTMALQTFESFGMVQIIDGVITIPNWGKHQNLDQLESKKEYMRGYMREYRAKQKALTSGKVPSRTPSENPSKTNGKAKVSQAEKEKEKDIEKNKQKKKKKSNNSSELSSSSSSQLEQVINSYHEICTSLTKVRSVTDDRKRAIKTLLTKMSINEIKEAFTKAENTPFLKGENDRGWKANIDFMLKHVHLVKILEGFYDSNKKDTSYGPSYNISEYEKYSIFDDNENGNKNKTNTDWWNKTI